MSPSPGWLTRMPRAAVILSCAVIAAACGGPVAARVSQHPATLPKASCGRAIVHDFYAGTQDLGGDHQALTCFSAAARGCRSASIEVTSMGVDTGANYVFTIEPGATPCQVAESSQDYSANFGGSTRPVSTGACQVASVSASGVMLSCAGQELLIPA